METLNKLYLCHSKVKNIFLFLAGAGVFSMMIYITADVLMRNFSTALIGTFEVVSYYIMPITILPSMCYALSSGVMPRIVALTGKLPHRIQRGIAIVLPALEIILYIMMLCFSAKYAISATKDGLTFVAGTKSLPVWQMYYLPPLSYLMMTVESAFVLGKNFLTGNTTILYKTDE